MTFVCNTATFTLIVLMLQITELRSKEQYLDTLASHNYDKELFLLEFLSVHSHFSWSFHKLILLSVLVSCHMSKIKIKIKRSGQSQQSRLLSSSK